MGFGCRELQKELISSLAKSQVYHTPPAPLSTAAILEDGPSIIDQCSTSANRTSTTEGNFDDNFKDAVAGSFF